MRIEDLDTDRRDQQNQLLGRVTDVRQYAESHNEKFEKFLFDSHYSKSCFPQLTEEDAIVATYMKYYGDDYDMRKKGITPLELTDE